MGFIHAMCVNHASHATAPTALTDTTALHLRAVPLMPVIGRSPHVDRTAANFGVLLVENPTKFGRHQSLPCFCSGSREKEVFLYLLIMLIISLTHD